MTGIEPDVLLSRVLDGEATPEDWAAFRAEAAREGTIWRDLAEAQQDRAALNEAVDRALAVADEIEAPVDWHLKEGLSHRVRSVMSYGGWLAAAVILVAAVFEPTWRTSPDTESPLTTASLANPLASPEDALRAYFDQGSKEGRVLGEVSEPVVLQYAPAADGSGIEVVYVRQIIERAVVDDMYRYGTDDAGRPIPIRAELPTQGQRRY